MFDSLYSSLVKSDAAVGTDAIVTYEMANGGVLVSAGFPVAEVISTTEYEPNSVNVWTTEMYQTVKKR